MIYYEMTSFDSTTRYAAPHIDPVKWPLLTPFQLATVARATKGVAAAIDRGDGLDACLWDVLGGIACPLRAEREAAEAYVREQYRMAGSRDLC